MRVRGCDPPTTTTVHPGPRSDRKSGQRAGGQQSDLKQPGQIKCAGRGSGAGDRRCLRARDGAVFVRVPGGSLTASHSAHPRLPQKNIKQSRIHTPTTNTTPPHHHHHHHHPHILLTKMQSRTALTHLRPLSIARRASHSASSERWTARAVRDSSKKEALLKGYKSRAALKLIDMNDKHKLFSPGMTVIDLVRLACPCCPCVRSSVLADPRRATPPAHGCKSQSRKSRPAGASSASTSSQRSRRAGGRLYKATLRVPGCRRRSGSSCPTRAAGVSDRRRSSAMGLLPNRTCTRRRGATLSARE